MKDLLVITILMALLVFSTWYFTITSTDQRDLEKKIKDMESEIQKCEAELPRNKKCKLLAVVDEGA